MHQPTRPARPWLPLGSRPTCQTLQTIRAARTITTRPCTCGLRTGPSGACGATWRPSGLPPAWAAPRACTTPACGPSLSGASSGASAKQCSTWCKPWKRSRCTSGACATRAGRGNRQVGLPVSNRLAARPMARAISASASATEPNRHSTNPCMKNAGKALPSGRDSNASKAQANASLSMNLRVDMLAIMKQPGAVRHG